jgi:hypothetical protein
MSKKARQSEGDGYDDAKQKTKISLLSIAYRAKFASNLGSQTLDVTTEFGKTRLYRLLPHTIISAAAYRSRGSPTGRMATNASYRKVTH